jgi:hypothetical protein
VLRRILGAKKEEIRGGCRKSPIEELNFLCSSSNKIGMIKSKGMRWAGHGARMGRRGVYIGFRRESQKKRDQ